ncbi:MAG: hypothetical protein M1819_002303 [Sarea resinae]|nr:MAG: hypothetical protein M1819_002303 [Sarea resinae]
MSPTSAKSRPNGPHPYSGTIPDELTGGQYVRNGGNPVLNEDLGRDAHWFDGDGMLTGVAFRRHDEKTGKIQPEFVNQFVLTDVLLYSASTPSLKRPILPSIATLVDPLSSLLRVILVVFRTIFLVILSHLPGSQQAIKRISVANTAILYHDGRALATCESGPPMRVSLPGLETVGWFNGKRAVGEVSGESGPGFGGNGMLSFMKEWTTAHPRVDPITKELLLYHNSFAPPYVQYSIIPPTYKVDHKIHPKRIMNAPVPGIHSGKLMHDFAVSLRHTVILDLPLSLDPIQLAKNKPVVAYDPRAKSRFGVFPRYDPSQVRWFETSACCIFHTANTWDDITTSPSGALQTIAVNMLASRLTSATIIFSAGDVAAPQLAQPLSTSDPQETEQCRLYYYQFSMSSHQNLIAHQWALSTVPFEFPSLREDRAMSAARYIYGTSVADITFTAALGRGVKINALVKMDVLTLIARGKRNPPTSVTGSVDTRTPAEILSSTDSDDPIQIFELPKNCYAAESRFVPRKDATREDDGYLVFYVFDESQLDAQGECPPTARSELWILDARSMKHVVARVHLPQRVPYGLHGAWFSEDEITNQRPIESMRVVPAVVPDHKDAHSNPKPMTAPWRGWMAVRGYMEHLLA